MKKIPRGGSGAVDARQKYLSELTQTAKRLGPNSWAALELKFAKTGLSQRNASARAQSIAEQAYKKGNK